MRGDQQFITTLDCGGKKEANILQLPPETSPFGKRNLLHTKHTYSGLFCAAFVHRLKVRFVHRLKVVTFFLHNRKIPGENERDELKIPTDHSAHG